MYCSKTITHVVKPGETIYQLAKRYGTTVPEILSRNQGVNPYRLQVDSKLIICPDGAAADYLEDEMKLNQEFRLAWERLSYWTRMYLLSVADESADQQEVNKRLDKVPEEMTPIFLKYYPGSVTYQLEQAWLGLVNNFAALIRAVKAEDTAASKEIEEKINQDRDNITFLLSNMNINYDKKELDELLDEYILLTKREIVARMEGQYEDEINTFDELENQGLRTADLLAEGIIKQYMGSNQTM